MRYYQALRDYLAECDKDRLKKSLSLGLSIAAVTTTICLAAYGNTKSCVMMALFSGSIVCLTDPLGTVSEKASAWLRYSLSAFFTALMLLAVSQVNISVRMGAVIFTGLQVLSAVSQNSSYILRKTVKQSAEVDRVLSFLSHSFDLDADEAWKEYGCAESRALLHQALHLEIDEATICGSYKAIYLLAYLHGAGGAEEEIEEIRATCEKQEEVINNLLAYREKVGQLERELANLTAEYERLKKSHDGIGLSGMYQAQDYKKSKERLAQLEKETSGLYAVIDSLKAENGKLKTSLEQACAEIDRLNADQTPTEPEVMDKATRDSMIRAYVAQGHTKGDTAKHFGVSAATVTRAMKEN